ATGGAVATLPLTPALSPAGGEGGRRPGEGETSGATAPGSRSTEDQVEIFKVVLDASLEVRSAVVYASFIVALVFLPVLTMTGLQGRFFAPLGTAFILAILASLAVALSVTPALCLALLSRTRPREEPGYLSRLKAFHRRALERISRRPLMTVTVALGLCAVAAATLPFFGGELLPEFRE